MHYLVSMAYTIFIEVKPIDKDNLIAFQILLILFCTFCDDGYCLFFSHNWNPYIYGILANLKGRFLCRSRWHLPLMTDFSVVRQLIGTRSPIGKLVFPLPVNCPAPEVRKEFRILCVSPHDRHIAHLLTIVYTEYLNYATSL